MLDYISRAGWDQALGFLAAGSPPVYLKLLAINAMFLAFHAIRRAAGASPLSGSMLFLGQLVVLGANLFVLFEPQVTVFATAFMSRF